MPGGDGTGPMGEGPMSGRAAGPCADNQTLGNFNRAVGFGGGNGRGYGRGQGGGRRFQRGRSGNQGRARGFMAANNDAELDMLRQQAAQMEATLSTIMKRLDQLAKDQSVKE